MKRLNIGKILCFLLCAILFSSFTLYASADMGPKPSVHIKVEDASGLNCWATLLSKTKSTGPARVWDGVPEHARNSRVEEFYTRYDIWETFVNYEDEDGFYFLQEAWQLDENGEFAWTYFPPDEFKILLYYPELQVFKSSEVCTRYAFDSYFTVNADAKLLNSEEEPQKLEVTKEFDISNEIKGFAARVLITVAVELIIALVFGYISGKQILFIASVNLVTQIILNLLLNIISFQKGPWAAVIWYLILEIAVFVIEAILYSIFLNKLCRKKKSKSLIILYALIANFASFGIGRLLMGVFPDIF